MGFYYNWEKQSLFIPQVKWYKVTRMVDYLHESRHRIIDKRHPIKYKEIESINAPLAKNSRFSSSEAYICEGIGNWNINFDLLLLAQSILNRDRTLNESAFQTMGEVEMYALDKINQLLHSVSNIDTIVTRERFEEMYSLEWIEYKSWFVLFAWFDDNHIMPVVVTGILQRVDKIWHNVAQS